MRQLENNFDLKKKILNPLTVFFIISFLGIGIFLLLLAIKGNEMFLWAIQENASWIRFIDFDMHFYFSTMKENLYFVTAPEEGCFPPFIYLMYAFLQRASLYVADAVRDEDSASVLFTYYCMMVGVLLYAAISICEKVRSKYTPLLFISLFFSATFFGGGYMVANSTMLVVPLLLIALKLMHSESKVGKEVSIILLAVCANIKIYPAIFWFLLLKEKRYKEAIRMIIYSVILFFVPFAFFGGRTGFMQWLSNVRETMGMLDFGRIQSVKGAVFTLLSLAGTPDAAITIATVCSFAFLLLMLVLAWLSKNKYKSVFFLIAAMTFFPSNSYRYTICFLAIPLVLYVLENKDMLKEKAGYKIWVNMIGFGLLFTIPVWWGALTGFQITYTYYTVTYEEVYIYVIAYALVIFNVVTEIIDLIRTKNRSMHERLS